MLDAEQRTSHLRHALAPHPRNRTRIREPYQVGCTSGFRPPLQRLKYFGERSHDLSPLCYTSNRWEQDMTLTQEITYYRDMYLLSQIDIDTYYALVDSAVEVYYLSQKIGG